MRRLMDDLSSLLYGAATDSMELELQEMEALFALCVVGSLTGLPATPSSVSLKLLPLLEPEINALISRASLADEDALALLAGHFDAF